MPKLTMPRGAKLLLKNHKQLQSRLTEGGFAEQRYRNAVIDAAQLYAEQDILSLMSTVPVEALPRPIRREPSQPISLRRSTRTMNPAVSAWATCRAHRLWCWSREKGREPM